MKEEKYEKELAELQRIKRIAIMSREKAPEGRLRSELAQGKYPQYYVISEEEKEKYPRGKYLKKKDIALAMKYAQKEYDDLILAEISRREKEIKVELTLENGADVNNVINKLPYAKRCLVNPYTLPDAEYVAKWERMGMERVNTFPVSKGFVTERGELVRSKSEKMIADKLYLKNVPYKYEAPLNLGRYGWFFPDFTILNIRTREEIYHEHFGMMDNPEYCKAALEKIDVYEENGLYLGERLFVSFESSQKSINMKQIENMIYRMQMQK